MRLAGKFIAHFVIKNITIFKGKKNQCYFKDTKSKSSLKIPT